MVCLLGVFMLLGSQGCHILKRAGAVKSVSEDENIVRKVAGAQAEWTFLEIRLTGKADEDGRKVGFMGTIKMERNKQVFIMLRSSIGIELARAYANRDSVWLISKMLSIKEKGDWKLADGKVGYPLDFFALQGILSQSLFTSAGDQIADILENLVARTDLENIHLVSKNDLPVEGEGIKYLNDFSISKETFMIQGVKIRDIRGQWISDVKYLYNKENAIKKIELMGIDSERNFSVEINVVKRDIKDNIEINFDKF
jgi:hypothetical protein